MTNDTHNNPDWEDVASPTAGDYTERLAVPGGWLYRTYFSKNGIVTAVTMTFVPGI